MKFTEIVKPDKTSIYFVDGKRVSYERFCFYQIKCNMENKRCNSAYTTHLKNGNWKHVAHYD